MMKEYNAMQSHSRPPKLKVLSILLMFIIGTLAISPIHQLIAQSCRTGDVVHVVESGQNLYRIGLLYGLPFDTLASYNGITDSSDVDAGMLLCIPSNTTSGSTTVQTVIVVVVTATPSANTPTTDTATTTTTTNTTSSDGTASGQENWCLNGGPWDDGRCIVPNDLGLQNYWFFSGWCQAQVELGNYNGTVNDCLNGRGSLSIGGGSSSSSSTTTTTAPISKRPGCA